VTKRADCRGANSKVSWTQVETGSAVTWKYPSCILRGDNSQGEFYSIAITNGHQQADTGTKMMQGSPIRLIAALSVPIRKPQARVTSHNVTRCSLVTNAVRILSRILKAIRQRRINADYQKKTPWHCSSTGSAVMCCKNCPWNLPWKRKS